MLNNCGPDFTHCPVHDMIKNQLFSIGECEFFVLHKNEYHICPSCVATFQRIINNSVRASTWVPPENRP